MQTPDKESLWRETLSEGREWRASSKENQPPMKCPTFPLERWEETVYAGEESAPGGCISATVISPFATTRHNPTRLGFLCIDLNSPSPQNIFCNLSSRFNVSAFLCKNASGDYGESCFRCYNKPGEELLSLYYISGGSICQINNFWGPFLLVIS